MDQFKYYLDLMGAFCWGMAAHSTWMLIQTKRQIRKRREKEAAEHGKHER